MKIHLNKKEIIKYSLKFDNVCYILGINKLVSY